ncbi:MAG: ArsR/SmtB family transcription factor [Candidatus Hodarchaeales archaeon]|jgi:DNA-binding transcriptional ArsR family regulator
MLAKNYQNALSAFFKALGNETRLTVLQLLQKNNELNVMEMCKQLARKNNPDTQSCG